MKYRKQEVEKVLSLLNSGEIFHGDRGNGRFRGRSYPFALEQQKRNLYEPICNDVFEYFKVNSIAWWGGKSVTTHPLSSQVACLNHLFPLRMERQAVLDIVRPIDPLVVEVLPVPVDEPPLGYIAFEVVSSQNHLNEPGLSRGANCTSVDALILGKRNDGKTMMFVIEWKYTEYYDNTDKGAGEKGYIRKGRYDKLINSSSQLREECREIYYFEPFYQLMRQTLWAEQVLLNAATEKIKADDFVHVHVIPAENADLLKKRYKCAGQDMETIWRGCLIDRSKYKIISPMDLLARLDAEAHGDLLSYLQRRYWD